MGRALLIFFLLFTVGCAEGLQVSNLDSPTSGDLGEVKDPDVPDLKICSELNFEGVQWSARFDELDRNAFAIALNVSGSYEGQSGWSNLTNNFDGQGISMGLLNQTLGTGSLQPLLYLFKKDFPNSYSQVLTGTLKTQMDSMLNQWAQTKGIASIDSKVISPLNLVKVFTDAAPEEKILIQNKLSEEVDKNYSAASEINVFGKAETDSVSWALRTVYTSSTGRTFKSEWKNALKAIAAHPDYISLQIEAAEYLHDRALRYSDRAGFTELRAYLMLFDIAVQNGSIRDSHFNTYFDWLSRNSGKTETEKLLQMVDIRAASSKPEYQDDVKRRKKTIVNGTGFVHGENRNLPQEYCYDPLIKYPNTIVKP